MQPTTASSGAGGMHANDLFAFFSRSTMVPTNSQLQHNSDWSILASRGTLLRSNRPPSSRSTPPHFFSPTLGSVPQRIMSEPVENQLAVNFPRGNSASTQVFLDCQDWNSDANIGPSNIGRGVKRSSEFSGLSFQLPIMHTNGSSTCPIENASPSKKVCAEHETHIYTERARRKKMNGMFSTLKALLPGLHSKLDKASVIEEAIAYIHSLLEMLESLKKRKADLQSNLPKSSQLTDRERQSEVSSSEINSSAAPPPETTCSETRLSVCRPFGFGLSPADRGARLCKGNGRQHCLHDSRKGY